MFHLCEEKEQVKIREKSVSSSHPVTTSTIGRKWPGLGNVKLTYIWSSFPSRKSNLKIRRWKNVYFSAKKLRFTEAYLMGPQNSQSYAESSNYCTYFRGNKREKGKYK
jgi:hypothetical protein